MLVKHGVGESINIVELSNIYDVCVCSAARTLEIALRSRGSVRVDFGHCAVGRKEARDRSADAVGSAGNDGHPSLQHPVPVLDRRNVSGFLGGHDFPPKGDPYGLRN
jgi:hypothetical protein